nr:HNH/endonuclease VII fold putative polymorphic toxin [Xenorhabdus cabanillasii]
MKRASCSIIFIVIIRRRPGSIFRRIHSGWRVVHQSKTRKSTSRRDALRQAKRDTGIPNNQQPKIDRVDLLDGNGKKIIGSNGQVIKVRQYHYTNKDGKPIVIQEHSLGHEKATPGHGAEPHFNVRPITNLGTGDEPGTHGHYNFPKR